LPFTGDDVVFIYVRSGIVGNSQDLGFRKVEYLCYHVTAAHGYSHCHSIDVDLISHSSAYCHPIIIIWQVCQYIGHTNIRDRIYFSFSTF